MRKGIYVLAAAALMFTACNKTELENNPENPDAVTPTGKVTFSGGFSGTETRTTIDENTNQPLIPVLWSPGDAIGIFGKEGATADNVRASLIEGAGKRNGKFTSATGIEMAETGNEFYLYYPYDRFANEDSDINAEAAEAVVKFGIDGSDAYIAGILPPFQEQKAPSDLRHFANYGYSVAVSEPADKDQEVKFTMEHVLSYIELQVYGSGLSGFSVDEITMVASKPLAGPFRGNFVPDAEGSYYEEAGGSATSYMNMVALTVENPQDIGGATSEAPQKFLLSILPANLTGENYKITFRLTDGAAEPSYRFYAISMGGKNFKSDHLTHIKADLGSLERIYPLRAAVIWNEPTVNLTGVELVSAPAANDLSDKLANSYIINAAGTYSIAAKMPTDRLGNGVWVEGVEPGSYNQIKFTVPAGVKGNVLIGIYRWNPDDPSNKSNTILYSWHLWVTDQPAEVNVGTAKFLDRNLGATSATDDAGSYGYYVQWGRKELFPRANSTLVHGYEGPQNEGAFTDAATLAVNMNTAVFSDELKWTLVRTKLDYRQASQRPTHFIDGTILYYIWNTIPISDGHVNMPSYNTSEITRWQAQHDPCPYGYHVMTRAEQNLITGAVTQGTRGSTVAGLWFPRTGYRNNEFGYLLNTVTALVWTDETKASPAPIGKYGQSLNVWATSFGRDQNGRISGGRSIRCVAN